MSLKQNLALTDADLNGMSVAGLTALYNELTPAKPVKKFETKAIALARVKKALDAVRPVAKEEAPEHVGTKPAAKKVVKPLLVKAVSVSGRMRELIRAGKTNAVVWELCQKEFDLPDSKKSYPAWYRRELRLGGEKV